jgi:hypothetical protein
MTMTPTNTATQTSTPTPSPTEVAPRSIWNLANQKWENDSSNWDTA